MDKKIFELRDEIDLIDSNILKLIEKRAQIVHEVGVIKGKTGSRVYVPERENQIFEALAKKTSVFSLKEVRNIFTQVISTCRALEKKICVFVLDMDSYFVASQLLGNSIEIDKREILSEASELFFSFDLLISKNSEEMIRYIYQNDLKIISNIKFLDEEYLVIATSLNGEGIRDFTLLAFEDEEKNVVTTEITGHAVNNMVQTEITRLEKNYGSIKILGSYEKIEL